MRKDKKKVKLATFRTSSSFGNSCDPLSFYLYPSFIDLIVHFVALIDLRVNLDNSNWYESWFR
jgi:hypothetical protein